MDTERHESPDPDWDAGRPPRRTLTMALARALADVVVVVAVYYLLPLDHPFGWRTLGLLLAGLVLIGVLAARQVRSVMRSPYPALRATETLALSIPLFLVLFAGAYQVLATNDPSAFSQHMSRLDTLYFVVTVFSTVGFGDITPVSEVARVITTVQMVGDLVLIGLVVRAMLHAIERGRAAAAAGRAQARDSSSAHDGSPHGVGEAHAAPEPPEAAQDRPRPRPG